MYGGVRRRTQVMPRLNIQLTAKMDGIGKAAWQRPVSATRPIGGAFVNTAMIADAEHHPPDLFVTGAALRSRGCTPDLLAEAAEVREISKILADDPFLALRRLLETARHYCHAESAGVSVLRGDAAGQEVVCWEVLSGVLASYEGTDLPRASSPCGLCLKAGTTVLVSRPERACAGLRHTRPAILEVLLVPLYDSAQKPLGTLWVAHHDLTSRFCSDDARFVEDLATQAVLALTLVEHTRERQCTLALFKSHQRAQHELLAHDVSRERSLREHAEESEREIRRELALKETAIMEAHHRVKNTLQIAAGVLSLHARATDSEQVRLALQRSHERLQLLAKVHELLYMSASSSEPILMPSLLDALGNAVRQSFLEMSTRVKLRIAVDSLRLPVEEAIAVAFLANEVVTNAYKHAFPNDCCGQVTVTLRVTPDDTLTLRITDDGIGRRASTTSSGIGLKLVRTFAAQLGGVLVIADPSNATGTAVTLTFSRRDRHVPLHH